jgi:hypothetical protein
MKLITGSLAKLALGAVTLLALSTMFADTASASRYAVAYGEFFVACDGTPGAPCPTD